MSEEFFTLIVAQAKSKKLLSDEHFTVDGTLIEAWAGQKSFQWKKTDDDALNPPPRDPGNNPTVNWHKEKRSNETHESSTDPMARLFKKSSGSEARLGFLGAFQQPVAVLRKHRWMPNRFAAGEPHEPAEQEIVFQLLHQHPLAPD